MCTKQQTVFRLGASVALTVLVTLSVCRAARPMINNSLSRFEPNCQPKEVVPSNWTPATSVHKLTPWDIKVVAAMGDSLSAATGAESQSIVGLFKENFGKSWSIGGDGSFTTHITMPNILRLFNPNLVGFSTGTACTSMPCSSSKGRGFNVALPWKKAQDLPDQARELIKRMNSSADVDFNNDWKIITILIGANDICGFCKSHGKNSSQPSEFIRNVEKAIDVLYEKVPRVYVNLVSLINITMIFEFGRDLRCEVINKFECDCLVNGNRAVKRRIVDDYISQYQQLTERLAASGKYDQRDDFTVVWQPFMEEFHSPRRPNGYKDMSYLAFDCFHFSTKGHAEAAVGLWNNMLQPVGQKDRSFYANSTILCPNEQRPYFYTNKNSNLTSSFNNASAQSF